jgi:hypothetical protein
MHNKKKGRQWFLLFNEIFRLKEADQRITNEKICIKAERDK